MIEAKRIRLGMTSGGSSFFDPVREGWEETCARLDVDCEYLPENWTWFDENYNRSIDLLPCVPQIRYFVQQQVDGISMQCGVDHPVLQQAMDAGIPLVAFDIPPTPEKYPDIAYVGTDNLYLGKTMARVLRLLKPQGGHYHVVSFDRIPERYQGFVQEIERDNNRLDRAHWYKATLNISGRPEGDNLTTGEGFGPSESGFAKLQQIASLNPDAVIFMYQSPMRHHNYTDFVVMNRWRDMTIIGTQGNNDELEYMARRYVDGLVGQVTYDMGRLSVETLYNNIHKGMPLPRIQYTKLINYNLVPEELPPVKVDQNLLGDLKYVGFVCFGVVTAVVLICLGWTIYHRKGMIVRASQPVFLVMTASGVWIMASAMVPLSFHDNGEEATISDTTIGLCMSIPWLAFIGFTVTFSALFSKTWRVNKFFHSKHSYQKIQVSEMDVLAPFAIILTLNIIVLICWTVIDPLTYVREYEDGTDLYNREIASNGNCRSDHAAAFVIPLAIINCTVLIFACVQAYQARNIKSEFAEANYIGLAVFSLSQAFVTGIPIVAVVKDMPQAFYVVLTCLIFLLSMVILLLIFLPKILIQRKYATMTLEEQRKALTVSVQSSSRHLPSRNLNADNSAPTAAPREGNPMIQPAKQPEDGGEWDDLAGFGSLVARMEDDESSVIVSTYAIEDVKEA